MIDGNDDRFDDIRDGNLSRIVVRIRDEGPAEIDAGAARPSETEAEDLPPAWDAGAMARLLREAEAPRSAFAFARPIDTPAPEPGPMPLRGAQEGPQDLSAPVTKGHAGKPHPSRLIWAVLFAALLTGGVGAVLYGPIPAADRPSAVDEAAGDPALRGEIAAIKTSIAELSKQLAAIASDGTSASDARLIGEHLTLAIGQMEDLERGTRVAGDLTVRVDELAQRLDFVNAELARLATTQPEIANAGLDAASPGAVGDAARSDEAIRAESFLEIGSLAPETPAVVNRPAPTEMEDQAVAATDGALSGEAKQILSRPMEVSRQADAGESVPVVRPRVAPAVTARLLEPAEAATRLLPVTRPSLQIEGAAGVPSGRSLPTTDSGTGPGPSLTQEREDASARSAIAVRSEPEDSEPDDSQAWLKRLAAFLEEEVKGIAEPTRGPGAGDGPKQAELAASQRHSAAKDTDPEQAGATGPWFINLIAVTRESTAQDLQRVYREKGIVAAVVPIDQSGLFGVRIEGFPSQVAAAARAAEIKPVLGIRDVWIGRS